MPLAENAHAVTTPVAPEAQQKTAPDDDGATNAAGQRHARTSPKHRRSSPSRTGWRNRPERTRLEAELTQLDFARNAAHARKVAGRSGLLAKSSRWRRWLELSSS
jgi:hypothetical protein